MDLKLVYGVYLLMQAALFTSFYVYYDTTPLFSCSCQKFQQGFPIAKASAVVINFNAFLLLSSVLKFYKKWIYIPVSFITLHHINAFFLYLFSLLHTIAHYFNLAKFNDSTIYFSWGVGFTGHFLWFILLCLFLSALGVVREYLFHKFYAIHVTLLFSFVTFIMFHQSFCFTKTNDGSCPLPTSMFWLGPVALVFVIETIYVYCQRYNNYNVLFHSNDIFELQIKDLPPHYSGKLIKICCPQLSWFEWHPFAVTFSENGYGSVHIKNRGNWTNKLEKLFGIDQETPGSLFPQSGTPTLLIQGPYVSLPNILSPQKIHLNKVILVSSGIGLTTFAHLLKNVTNYKNLYVIIIAKSPGDIQFIMRHIPNHPHIQFFFTSLQIKSLSNFFFNYSIGRPQLKKVIQKISLSNDFTRFKTIHIFHSGIHSVSQQLKQISKEFEHLEYSHIH